MNGTSFLVNSFTPLHSVIAEGQFTAGRVGTYEPGAQATSVGGTGQSRLVDVSVNYAMSWLPPISLGRTISGAMPIKFAARDCRGNFVADTSVRVEGWEAGLPKFTAVYGEGSDAVRIQQDDEHDIVKFNPVRGSHTYTVKVYFNNYPQAWTTVATK